MRNATYHFREFARRLDGLSAAYVSDIELGRRFPSEGVLLRMAQVLSVNVAELRELDSRPPVEELRRRAQADPAYGIALRRMVERDVNPEDILKIVEKKSKEDLK